VIGRWRVGLALLAMAASAIGGGTVAERAPAATSTACGTLDYQQPFLPWLDPANYVIAPDGAVEGVASGWKLAGGAKAAHGNESFYVRSAKDARSLSLPPGSSATTPAICVGVDSPTIRFFALNSGSLLSTLNVEVIYRNVLGLTVTAPVATLTGTSAWQPTLPLLFLANVTSLNVALNNTTTVWFRFTPQGSSSGWRIDDLYVDPFKGA
jgi:hypothetical protein